MARRNSNFDFPPASDSAIGSLTERFQGFRQALNPDRESGESSYEQQHHSHRRPATNSTRQRRRTIQPYGELPQLRASRSSSSSPAAYTPPTSRPGRGRHWRNPWRRIQREMLDETANLEGLVRDRQVHLRQLHSQLNGAYYAFEKSVCHS
jgi:hypothetical protein